MLKAKYITLTLSAIGFLLLSYSANLNAYTNEQHYFNEYNLLYSSSDTEAFYALRNLYLTPKYQLENYGVTMLIISLSIWILFRKGWTIRTPQKKNWIAVIGLVAVISTSIAIVGDLFLDAIRGEFPLWADTLIIPLMSIPPVFLILLVWYSLQLTGFIGSFKTHVRLRKPHINIAVILYAFQLTALLVITGMVIFQGAFWFVVPAIIWCTFFTYLLIGRSTNESSPKQINDKRHFF